MFNPNGPGPSVAQFVRRSLNRKKAALLTLEARHLIGENNHSAGSVDTGGGPRCPMCRAILDLREQVDAGEIALKQAEAIR